MICSLGKRDFLFSDVRQRDSLVALHGYHEIFIGYQGKGPFLWLIVRSHVGQCRGTPCME